MKLRPERRIAGLPPASRSIARVLLAALLLLPVAAVAATFAVVPLVGRQMTVVTAQPVTSTNLDRNRYQSFPFTDDVFDQAIRDTVDRAVRERRATDSTLLVRSELARVLPGVLARAGSGERP